MQTTGATTLSGDLYTYKNTYTYDVLDRLTGLTKFRDTGGKLQLRRRRQPHGVASFGNVHVSTVQPAGQHQRCNFQL
jgi:hypothetical protein